MINKKSIKKHERKRIYKQYLSKQNDDGFRHYHCPTCFDNDKLLVEGKNIDGEWNCNRCGTKWIIVA